jgi:hypothetical protein
LGRRITLSRALGRNIEIIVDSAIGEYWKVAFQLAYNLCISSPQGAAQFGGPVG